MRAGGGDFRPRDARLPTLVDPSSPPQHIKKPQPQFHHQLARAAECVPASPYHGPPSDTSPIQIGGSNPEVVLSHALRAGLASPHLFNCPSARLRHLRSLISSQLLFSKRPGEAKIVSFLTLLQPACARAQPESTATEQIVTSTTARGGLARNLRSGPCVPLAFGLAVNVAIQDLGVLRESILGAHDASSHSDPASDGLKTVERDV